MWSLPSRSLATASVSFVAVLVIAQTSAVKTVSAQADCIAAARKATPAVSPGIHTPPSVNLIANGDFGQGLSCWLPFATPDPSYIVSQETAGLMEFYRVPQPAGERPNQAVMFQMTNTPLMDYAPILARFDLGNSSDVRKRISVLIHEGDFTDLRVCTFWLAPHAPIRTYRMQTFTTRTWTNTSMSFYAATPGGLGGFYQVDNVSLTYEPTLTPDRTLCDDPTAPLPASGTPDGPNLLVNGDFSNGMGPWATFHNMTSQVTNGIFEFIWGPPAPVSNPPPFPILEPGPTVIQRTALPMAAGEILTAHVDLGNTSTVRKRVSLLIHQWDFDDLAACTFWLEPGAPLRTYTMRMFATEAWTDASFSVFAATRGPESWIQMDNAVLHKSPGAEIGGKECYESTAVQPSVKERSAKPARTAGGSPVAAVDFGRRSSTRTGDSAVIIGTSSLRYAVPPSDVALQVQVSEDGQSWQTLHTVEPSEDWRILTLDTSVLGARQMFVRIVK